MQTALDECRAEQIKRPDEQILRRNEANILLILAIALENSGASREGFERIRKSLAVREKIAAENLGDSNYQTFVADAEIITGQRLVRQNQPTEAADHFRRAHSSYEKAVASDSERIQSKILAARTRIYLGNALVINGKTSEVLTLLHEAVNFFETINAGISIDANLKSYYAESLLRLADALSKNRENQDEALELYRRNLEIWEKYANR